MSRTHGILAYLRFHQSLKRNLLYLLKQQFLPHTSFSKKIQFICSFRKSLNSCLSSSMLLYVHITLIPHSQNHYHSFLFNHVLLVRYFLPKYEYCSIPCILPYYYLLWLRSTVYAAWKLLLFLLSDILIIDPLVECCLNDMHSWTTIYGQMCTTCTLHSLVVQAPAP